MDRECLEGESAVCVADDLVSLAQLTDHSILNCLRERYHDDQIYTYAGDVLVSINPNKTMPLYSSRHVLDYQRTHGNSACPHIYATAELALTEMLQNCSSQCCIMLGISGAGKTQCSHYFSRYILDSAIMLPSDKEQVKKVKQRRELMVHSLSVAAAFSHAAVPTNSSSSRCCRYLEMFFNAAMGEYMGGRISMPLLEIDRVFKLDRSNGQSNYSIFYRMLYGLSEDMLKQLFLTDNPQNYAILSGCDHNGDDEAIQFRRLCIHLNSLGFGSPTHQLELFSVLAAVIHLGEAQRGVASGLQNAAQLLGVGQNALEKCLDQLSDNSSTSYPLLGSLLYHYLFNFILSRINERVSPDMSTKLESLTSISVLDPVGSQGVCQTSLHCLCSNYVEEVIQHLYYHRMFVWEQEVYNTEGIEWNKVEFVNNDAVLSLYNEPKGLWKCLDESDDDSVVAMAMELCSSHHDVFYSTEAANHFTVSHSVGEVTYHVDQWSKLNGRNKMADKVQSLLVTSKTPLVCSIAKQMSNSCDQVCGKYVVGDTQSRRTKAAMDMLKRTIVSTTPYFVCCIRPSDDNNKEFMDSLVLAQLQMMSLLDTTLLQSRGFPVHMTFSDFAKRYSVLLLGSETKADNDEETCYKIIANARLDGWKTGKTQLLLKPWHKTELDGLLDEYESNACTIQRAFRRHSSKKRSERRQSNQSSPKSPTPPSSASFSCEHKSDRPPAIPQKKHRPPRKSASESNLSTGSYGNDDTYLEIFPNLPTSPLAVTSPLSVTSPSATSPLVANSPITSPPAVTSPPANSSPISPVCSDSERRNSSVTMGTIMEEDEENYLAMLSDRADHCVTRKRTMILSHRQAAKLTAAMETMGNGSPPPIPQRPPWAEHSVNGMDGTKVIKPLHHVIQDDLDKESWYHGSISRDEAESRLKQAGINCFLIRVSTSQADGYALSMRNNDVIKHYRIIKKSSSGRYEIFGNSRSFPAMKVLVDYHHKCAISVDGEILSVACPKEVKTGVLISPPPVPPRSRLASEPPPRIKTSSIRYKSVSWQRNKSEGSILLDGGFLSPKDSLTGSMDSALLKKSPQIARSKATIMAGHSPACKKKGTKRNWSQEQSDFAEMLNQSYSSASHETLQELEKEIIVAERIVDAASRLADLQADRQTKKERKDHLKTEQAKLHALKQRLEKLREHRRIQDISEIVEKSRPNGSFHGNNKPLHPHKSKSDGTLPPALPPRPLHTIND